MTTKGRRSRHSVALALGLLVLAGLPGTVAAQEPMQPGVPDADSTLTDPRAAALDAESANIAAQLRCPVCSGQSVLESNSDIAQQMQEVIRERLDEGQSEREILAYFRGSYGDWIILTPRPAGISLLVYVLPAVALLGGIAWVIVAVRRWSARPSEPGPVAGDTSGVASDAGAPDDHLSAEDEAWLRRSIGGG